MSVFTPEEITELAANSGRKKAHLSLLPMLILGFFGGAFYRIRVFTRYSCYWDNAKILGIIF